MGIITMNSRIDVLLKIIGIIILIALVQIPIFYMQQYAVTIVGDNYFIHLQSQAYDYANSVIDAVRGENQTISISKQYNYNFVIDSLNNNYLTLALAFTWLLVIDVLSRAKLVWFHYVIVTIGLVLFYLFELVLAHYCSISQFYFISVAVVVTLLVGYLSGSLKRIIPTIFCGVGLVLNYILAYYLMLYANYPLVYVSICLLMLFIAIITMMRKINWHEQSKVTNGDVNKLH